MDINSTIEFKTIDYFGHCILQVKKREKNRIEKQDYKKSGKIY